MVVGFEVIWGGGVCNSDEFHKSYAYLMSKNTQKEEKNAFFAPKISVVFADGLEIKFFPTLMF